VKPNCSRRSKRTSRSSSMKKTIRSQRIGCNERLVLGGGNNQEALEAKRFFPTFVSFMNFEVKQLYIDAKVSSPTLTPIR
jgi:hypothetical protein